MAPVVASRLLGGTKSFAVLLQFTGSNHHWVLLPASQVIAALAIDGRNATELATQTMQINGRKYREFIDITKPSTKLEMNRTSIGPTRTELSKLKPHLSP